MDVPKDAQLHLTLWDWAKMVGVILSVLISFLFTGLKDWVREKFWDAFFAGRKKERDEEASRFATIKELDAFKATTAVRMDELGRVTTAAANNMIDVADKVETRIQNKMDNLDQSMGEHLVAMHEKVNQNNERMAKLEQQVKDLPDVIVGKLALSSKISLKPSTPSSTESSPNTL